ncbi:MAG: CoA-binding protein [Bacteroidota bacterium]|nr:CoA-binding protein [Bacteroidota bacterium]
MKKSRKTVLIGATPNETRYAYWAAKKLMANKHETILIGIKKGHISNNPILNSKVDLQGVHTVTLYLGPARQQEYYDYILKMRPKRIIFNPGTENPELVERAQLQGIETLEDCTLMMLDTGRY